MISEAPYLFSIAALSVSLAGFAGLVAAFRRGGAPRPIDFYRLRQIAEFGLANAFLALLPIPLAATLGEAPQAVRIASVVVFAYVIAYWFALIRQARRLELGLRFDPIFLIFALNVAILASAIVAAAMPSTAAFEWLLLFLLARPMLAFVLVLGALGDDGT